MSNSSIEGRLRGLEERLANEVRIRREGGFQSPGGLGAPRPGSGRRPRPPLFTSREIPAYPPRSPQATETEHRMREVYKVSGKLNVDGVEYRSSIDELQQLGELGSGTCGHVVKMLHRPSGAVIAVKQMRRSGNSEETKRILMDLDVVVRSHDCPYIVRCLGCFVTDADVWICMELMATCFDKLLKRLAAPIPEPILGKVTVAYLDVVVRSHDCPYIVRCLGCFVTDADVWICMELMATCFDKLLKRLAAPIPEPILGKVTVATVNALSYLKDTHGVIHRDVKPSNILLDERGNIKLCDFGISGRLVDSKAKTRSAGCAAYMAPERIDPPDPARPDYDIRADVWSLGISLVELATGVFPYRDCHNDFEVLTRVISDDPPELPDTDDFSPEFKLFVSQCLTKNYRQRPKYAKLLEHPFVVKSSRSSVSVGAWYASLPMFSPGGKAGGSIGGGSGGSGSGGSGGGGSSPGTAPSTPQAPRSRVSAAQYWLPEQITPTPARAWWANTTANAGGSSSQPASLETDFSNHSPYPRRRTLDACASPPPAPPARRVSADTRWRPSPASSGNTSPIVLQRFQHQSQQRVSRADLHTPRHRSLSKEHYTGRSPEPPPRTSRQHYMLGHDQTPNGSMELEPPPLHERLQPPSLLLNDRLSEGRSQSLTRAELRNGFASPRGASPRPRGAPPVPPPPAPHHDDHGWLHSLAGLLKRRLSGYVKWHHVTAREDRRNHHRTPPAAHSRRWHAAGAGAGGESWSMPASPLPPRAPPPRPGD